MRCLRWLVIGAAAALLREMDNRRSWVVLGLAGAVAVASSLPSPFVCAGVVLALSIQAFREGRVRLLSRIGLLGLFWAALFSLLYSRFYRTPGNAPYMREFWEGAFLTPGSPHLLARTRRALFEVSSVIDPGLTLLGLGCAGAGVGTRRGSQTAPPGPGSICRPSIGTWCCSARSVGARRLPSSNPVDAVRRPLLGHADGGGNHRCGEGAPWPGSQGAHEMGRGFASSAGGYNRICVVAVPARSADASSGPGAELTVAGG